MPHPLRSFRILVRQPIPNSKHVELHSFVVLAEDLAQAEDTANLVLKAKHPEGSTIAEITLLMG